MKIEVCVSSVETAIAAYQLGADRVELCLAPIVGGLTPNYGLIEACVEQTDMEVSVMIRHNEGGFVYSDDDIDIMLKDIEMAKVAGATGVVFGCLTEYNLVNHDQCEMLISRAQALGLDVTFHRAFDFLEDPFQGLEVLIDLGFDRVLTSGQKQTAEEGISLIQQLVRSANQSICIMAGSGINAGNALKIARTGVDAIHFTAHQVIQEPTGLGMGTKTAPDMYKIQSVLEVFK